MPLQGVSCSVAVIGAGAAGLAAAKELRAEGHRPVVFEQGGAVGGVWSFDPATDEEPLGLDPHRERVHSSTYANLRTNLPREIMSYLDFPFTSQFLRALDGGSGRYTQDARRYPGHLEVGRYLDAFADYHGVRSLIRLHTRVVNISPIPRPAPTPKPPTAPSPAASQRAGAGSGGGAGGTSQEEQPCSSTCPAGGSTSTGAEGLRQPLEGDGAAACLATCPRWRVVTEVLQDTTSGRLPVVGRDRTQCDFDAVVVCNGHYAEPRLPDDLAQAAQREGFPGYQMHSHSYRSSERFAGQVVLVVGASNSGDDIARDVARVARTVHLSARSWKFPACAGLEAGPSEPPVNILRCAMATQLCRDGSVVLNGGHRIPHVDSVIYCTGYHYCFPFLDGAGVVSAEGGHVYPLYRHMFPPATTPSLSFIGVRQKIIPFLQVQLQSRLVARLLSGRVRLPDRHALMDDVSRMYRVLDEKNVPYRVVHHSTGVDELTRYNAWLVEACGDGPLPAWRAAMHRVYGENRLRGPCNYWDVWEDPGGVMRCAEEELGHQAARLLQSRHHSSAVPRM